VGDTERFLIATLSRNGYRSFEPRLLQQIKNLKAESKLCGHQKTLKDHEPLSVVTPNDQQVDIQLPSTYRVDRLDGYFILVYIFTATNYSACKNGQTVILLQEVHFVSNFFTLANEHPYFIHHLIMSDEAHFELPGWVNKKTCCIGVQLIRMN
jgi:hypothetical protein